MPPVHRLAPRPRSLAPSRRRLPLTARRACLHDGGMAAGAAALLELQASFQGAPRTFRGASLRATVALLDELDGQPRAPPPLPGAGTAAPPPLPLLSDAAAVDEEAAALAAEGAVARALAQPEETLGSQVLWLVASVPGDQSDRAEILELLAQALSPSPWLSGQLVTAVARAEAGAAAVRGERTLPAAAAMLEDWVGAQAGAPEEAGLGAVLLSVLESAAHATDLPLAWWVLGQLQSAGGHATLPLSASKLVLAMASRCTTATAVQDCLDHVHKAVANGAESDAELHTLLLRAELVRTNRLHSRSPGIFRSNDRALDRPRETGRGLETGRAQYKAWRRLGFARWRPKAWSRSPSFSRAGSRRIVTPATSRRAATCRLCPRYARRCARPASCRRRPWVRRCWLRCCATGGSSRARW